MRRGGGGLVCKRINHPHYTQGTLDIFSKFKNPTATDGQCSTTRLFTVKMQLSPPIYTSRKALRDSHHQLTNSSSLVSTNPPKNDVLACAIMWQLPTPPARIHPPEAFLVLSCCFWSTGLQGQSQVSPQGLPLHSTVMTLKITETAWAVS